MPAGPLSVYDSALSGMLSQSLPSLVSSPVSAVLLNPGHEVDLAAHSRFSDVEAFEIDMAEYRRQPVTGARVIPGVGGASFHTDTIHFGDPVTIGPVAYLVIAYGAVPRLSNDSPLLGIAELSVEGGAVEAQRSSFSVSAPASGWFEFSRTG